MRKLAVDPSKASLLDFPSPSRRVPGTYRKRHVLNEKALLHTHWEKGKRPGGLVTSGKNSALWLLEPVSDAAWDLKHARRTLERSYNWPSNGDDASLFRICDAEVRQIGLV